MKFILKSQLRTDLSGAPFGQRSGGKKAGILRQTQDKLRRKLSPKKIKELTFEDIKNKIYSSFLDGTRKTSIKPSGKDIFRNFSSRFNSIIQSLIIGITICFPAKVSTK